MLWSALRTRKFLQINITNLKPQLQAQPEKYCVVVQKKNKKKKQDRTLYSRRVIWHKSVQVVRLIAGSNVLRRL